MRVESPSVRCQVRALERVTSFVGKALFFAAMTLLVGKAPGADPSNGTMIAFVFGPLLVAVSYLLMVVMRPRVGSLEIAGDEAVIQRGGLRTKLKLRSIASAHVVKRGFQVVELRTRAGNVWEIAMPDGATAAAVVEALGFGRGGRAVTIDLAKRSRRLLNVLLGGAAIVVGLGLVFVGAVFASIFLGKPGNGGGVDAIMFAWFALTALSYAFLKRWLAPEKIAVGTDGVAVTRGLRTVRIPRAEIAGTRLARADGPLVIDRRHGPPVVVGEGATDDASIVAAAIECDQRLRAREELPAAATFERGARAVGEWKAGLRAALDAGYRNAGASVDDARTVLASPSASTEQRLGAALALRVAGEPPEKIRVAAEGVVDPNVRSALEAIAEDEDARLERTLKKMTR